MAAEAAIRGHRHLALQALLADARVDSVANPRTMLSELLAAHAAYLPTFDCQRQ